METEDERLLGLSLPDQLRMAAALIEEGVELHLAERLARNVTEELELARVLRSTGTVKGE